MRCLDILHDIVIIAIQMLLNCLKIAYINYIIND